jgi:hypothetical protein
MEKENKIEWVSPSKLKLWSSCKWAFYARYRLKLPDPGNEKTHLGTLLHLIFQVLADPKKPLSVQKYRKKLVLDSVKAGSISPVLIKFYQKLIRKFKIPDDLEDLGKELMLDAFTKGYDIHYPVVAVEDYFEIPLTENVGIRGSIDKIIDLGGTFKGACEAKDYKSGQPFTVEKCKDEYQPYFYAIAIKNKYPYKIVLFSFHFLKNHKTVHVDIDDKYLETFKREVIIKEGEAMAKLTEKTATPNKSWLCSCCKFKEPNKNLNYGGCPLYYTNGKSRFKQ